MEIVRLRNGAEVPQPTVLVTWMTLRTLAGREPLTLIDAVEHARTGEPQPFSAARLEALALTTNGSMHRDVADVIVSATVGKDFDLQLQSPVAPAS